MGRLALLHEHLVAFNTQQLISLSPAALSRHVLLLDAATAVVALSRSLGQVLAHGNKHEIVSVSQLNDMQRVTQKRAIDELKAKKEANKVSVQLVEVALSQ